MTKDDKKGGEKGEIFCCLICDYNTCDKWKLDRHLSTSKHKKDDKRGQNDYKKGEKGEDDNIHFCDCGKKYRHRQGLWKHKQVCNFNNLDIKTNDGDKNIVCTNNKDDLIQYLINENKEFKNLILEIVKKDNITNNNNHINSHNKTFNLQIFLNETCKDAMNMSEFIESMKLQLSDLESVGKLGFVDGISNIIINNLKALDVEKRPVHCSDAKRETMYIKDQDKWEKEDDELNKMKQMVRQVRDKNISLITSWRDLYPECLLSNSKKTDQYNNICMESFGFKKEREEKIISKIAKSVIIDKINL
jgi:hypothetical protein